MDENQEENCSSDRDIGIRVIRCKDSLLTQLVNKNDLLLLLLLLFSLGMMFIRFSQMKNGTSIGTISRKEFEETTVIWDNGTTGQFNDPFELKIVDNASAGV